MVGLHRLSGHRRSAAPVALLGSLVQSRPKVVGGERRILLGGRGGLLHGIRSRSESHILHGRPEATKSRRRLLPVGGFAIAVALIPLTAYLLIPGFELVEFLVRG